MSSFVHLRLHTEFSLRDSVVRVPELMAAVAAAGMPAVALTDQHNLFAMVKFYRAAQRSGVKPLIGVDLLIAEPGERTPPSALTLLCMDDVGYRNLTRLVSRSYLEGQKGEGAQKGVPLVARAWLTRAALGGLVALSGGAAGDIGRLLAATRRPEAERCLDAWLELFDDRFYLEVTRVGRAGEEAQVAATVALAAARGVPIVATNDVRFLRASDFEAHEARVCIADGMLLGDPARPRRYTPQQFLRSPAEMHALFADLPEALANSVEIARRCSLELRLGESRLPHYPVPEGMTIAEFLASESARGFEARRRQVPAERADAYRRRLDTEIGVITQMGFAGYFLIVADFIRWARENGIPVGPGRGSGAGSVVAWVLGITDIDPLRYDLLFERFLNPERVSMPDFDIDFCINGRDRVIDYVAQKYGRERVSQIITYGTMAAKAVLRDAGRVLGLSYGYCDRIAKLVPFELDITLDAALAKEPELKRLYAEDEEARNLIDLARSLEGLTRNAGKHAGGVVIAPSVLTDFAPLYCEEGGDSVVTQFDKDDVEAAGLVKFDFLGLRTLTIIDRAVHTIDAQRAARGEPPLSLAALPLDDAATYALLKACRTTAVFQLESRGMKDLIRRLQPDCFEDIIALVALFRPGPLQSGMVEDFITRKHDRTGRAIDYLHPRLEPALRPTYGVILYQEQVMQIAQLLAGYTLGGADQLRRAMGKKKPEEMAQQRSVFVDGAKAQGVPEAQAAHIFDLMEKFAGYGFNKSHSAGYAVLSFQTAYLKAHHAAPFMAAVLSLDLDHTDKVVTLKDECDRMGLAVLPPHVNESVYDFMVADERTIRYGLGAIKGVGRAVVEALVAERTARGPFTGLEDLCRRLDLAKVNRRVLEALVRSGSLDGLGVNRATLMARVPAAMQLGEQATRAIETGQVDLFGLVAAGPAPAAGAGADADVHATQPGPALPEWPDAARLAGERETLGLYLSGHPINRYEADLRHFVSGRIGDLLSSDRPALGGERAFFGGKTAAIAGYVHEVRKRGNRFSVLLDDRTGRMEVTFFEDTYQQYRALLVKDALLCIEGQLRFDEFSDAWRLAARTVVELDRLREQRAEKILLNWPDGVASASVLQRLAALLEPHRGGGQTSIVIRYANEQASGRLLLGPGWRVRANPVLLGELEAFAGAAAVRLVYGPAAPVGQVARGAGPP
jgi:DNA polymerase-3 subunit alpha